VARKKKKKVRGRWDNLKKNKNLKLRQDYIDTHYIDGMRSITGKGKGIRALTEEEKDWLNKFYGEYTNASVNHESYDDQLHDNEDLVRDCYDRNNSRNRCVLNKGKAINTVDFRSWGELDQDTIEDSNLIQESLNNRLDNYEDKLKAFKRVSKVYPDLFTEDEFMSYDIELIFNKLNNYDSKFD
jgi:hypothetical protein